MDMLIEFPGGARVDAHLGEFTIKTDQPVAAGGDNSAPAPFELFLASIGTCAGIYISGFCRSRGISTDHIRLVQRHAIDPATHMVTGVSLDIELPVDFPERYKPAVIRAAEMCKVKKHLEQPPHFEIHAVTRELALAEHA